MSNLYSKYTYFGHNYYYIIMYAYKRLIMTYSTENNYNYLLYTILVQAPAPAPGPAAPVKFRPGPHIPNFYHVVYYYVLDTRLTRTPVKSSVVTPTRL